MAFNESWNYIPSVLLLQVFSYLEPRERLIASSTCRAWRDCLYTPSLWPVPRIRLILSTDRNITSKSQLSRSKSFKANIIKAFVGRCARFLQHITLEFDPSTAENLQDVVQVLQMVRSHSLTEGLRGSRLKSLTLKPTASLPTVICNQPNRKERGLAKEGEVESEDEGEGEVDLVASFWEAIERVVVNAQGLQHLSLGCIEELLNQTPSLLSALAQKGSHNQTLESLHISSVKEDPDFYPVLDFPPDLLLPFSNLKSLSIDYDYICDELLLNLIQRQKLEKLVINVHGVDDDHPVVSKSCWSRVSQTIPSLEVTVNLLHTNDSLENLRDIIFDTDIPLTTLRAYYSLYKGHGVGIVDLINTVAIRHQNTLRSLTLIDYLNEDTALPNAAFSRTGENPLVMLAWRCKKLESLSVIGFEIMDADLIAITRLRGAQLKELRFPSCCISLMHSPVVEDEGYYDDDKFYLDMAPVPLRRKVVEEVAKPLSREWLPLAYDEMPKAVFDPYHSPESTYLIELLKDQSW